MKKLIEKFSAGFGTNETILGTSGQTDPARGIRLGSRESTHVQLALRVYETKIREQHQITLHGHRLLHIRDPDRRLFRGHSRGCSHDVRHKCVSRGFPAGLPRMNKKVPELMKDEACGRIITKIVCLGPKQYAYEVDGGGGERKCKGVKKGVVKNTLTTGHYVDCLRNETTYLAKFNTLRSRKYDITTECVTKVALTAADNKRIIIFNDPEHGTLALGHWRAKHPDLYKTKIKTERLFEKGSLMNLAYKAIR